MGRCGCAAPVDCGCVFDESADITASGVGSAANPLVFAIASGRSIIRICTSGTRPSPSEGMVIYETDTKRYLEYDGTRWRPTVVGAFKTYVQDGLVLGQSQPGPVTIAQLTVPDQGWPYFVRPWANHILSGSVEGDQWEVHIRAPALLTDYTIVRVNMHGAGLGVWAQAVVPSRHAIAVASGSYAVSSDFTRYAGTGTAGTPGDSARNFLAAEVWPQ